MKRYFRGRRAVYEGDVQALRLQELDSYVLKSSLLDGYVLHVMKLALTCCGIEEMKRLHATDGSVAHKFRRYQVTVN